MVKTMLRRIAGLSLALGIGAAPLAATPLEDQLRAAVEAGELPGLHSTVVDLNGTRLAEVYFTAEDEIWGRPIGPHEHGPDTLHDLRSVTKSIVGLLYGMALAEGKVPAPDQPLLAQFPDYADLHDGGARDRILIEHALTMQMGTDWNEDLPYSDPRNSEIAMERAQDRYRYVLDRPMVSDPGERWTYNGGAVALLGKLIADGTGMPLEAYAQARLFAPLGIEQFEWSKGADGVASAASGLRLTARDLAKIGALVANDGAHDGVQIVPQDWLAQSLQAKATLNGGIGYGYLWYLAGSPPTQVAIAVGNGGQRLSVQPNAGLVVATYCGRYNDPNSWQTSLKVMLDFAVPEAKRLLSE